MIPSVQCSAFAGLNDLHQYALSTLYLRSGGISIILTVFVRVGSVSSVCGRCSGVEMFRFCLCTKGGPESYSSWRYW